MRYDIARPSTTDSERTLNQLRGLVIMRVAVAVPDWVHRCVEKGLAGAIARAGAWWSIGPEQFRSLFQNADLVGWRAAEDVEGRVSALLAGVEDLRPAQPRVLAVLQEAVDYPADVLRHARVPKARRDRSAMKLYPHDVYNLTPKSLAELHPMMPELLASWEKARVAVLRERYGG